MRLWRCITARVHRTDDAIGPIAFHPNGRELFFVLDRSQYDAHIRRVPLGGGDAEAITQTENWHEWSFALSPDGERLLLENGRYGGADLYLIELGDTLNTLRAERLTRTPEVNEFGDAARPAHGRERPPALQHRAVPDRAPDTRRWTASWCARRRRAYRSWQGPTTSD